MGTFYNTTGEVNPQLSLFKERAEGQEAAVLGFFEKNGDRKFLRENIEGIFYQYPTASVVRTLNSLMKAGKILKLNEYRVGKYGVRCHLWQLKK